jgi:hypothetical protein
MTFVQFMAYRYEQENEVSMVPSQEQFRSWCENRWEVMEAEWEAHESDIQNLLDLAENEDHHFFLQVTGAGESNWGADEWYNYKEMVKKDFSVPEGVFDRALRWAEAEMYSQNASMFSKMAYYISAWICANHDIFAWSKY